MPQKIYSPQELKERLAYDPETGALTWIKVRASTLLGKEAKCLDVAGYIQVNLPGAVLKGHRIAWAIHYGEWPKGQIDHINGVRNDNRIANLRDVSNQINCQNQRNGVRPNKTGFIGVHLNGGKYRAKIWLNGKQIYLGGFDTPEEAHAAYVAKKRELHEGNVL
jgi:hypothetical protein